MKGAISDRRRLRVGSPAIVHHTAEHPSAYGAFGGGGDGWLVVNQASRCLTSVHGPYATREAARAEVRRLKAQAEARREARRHGGC